MASIDIITGHTGASPVTSNRQGAINAATFGEDAYILSGCAATMASANSFSVTEGYIMVQGRAFHVPALTLSIANGTQGQKRADLICAQYGIADDIESGQLVVVKGTPGTTATDPSTTGGSILDGDASVQVPIWRVTLDGIDVSGPVQLVPTVNGLACESAAPTAQNAWAWRKWADGRAELWMDDYYPGSNLDVSVPWGGAYHNDVAVSVALPFALVQRPHGSAHMWAVDSGALLNTPCSLDCDGTTSTCPSIKVISGSSGTFGHPHFGVTLAGRWK